MEITKGLHAFLWRDFQVNNCNTYLMRGSKNILIDPGLYQLFGNVRTGLSDLNLSPEMIELVMITHGHFDHMGAAEAFGSKTLVAIGGKELDFLNASSGLFSERFMPDALLEEGDLVVGDISLQIMLTPGHSPGSICVYWPDRKALFSGDVLFTRSVGRTDLPGGQGKSLKESILRIAELDIEYLLPGHGEIVTGRQAVKDNFREIAELWFPYLD
jgi:hydroxyacylglutathione hydrolase